MKAPRWHSGPLALGLVATLLCPVPFLTNPVAAQQSSSSPRVERGVEVRGRVVAHDTGQPLGGAAVSLGPGGAGVAGMGTRVTSEGGRFLFREVPPGAYRLTVTLLGYHTMADTVQVPSEGWLDIEIPLSTRPIPLDPIVVEADRGNLSRPGFQGRDRAGQGPYLLTREDIERRNPMRVTSLLASVPGARVVSRNNLGSVLLLRGGCLPTIVLDGVKFDNIEYIDRLVSPGDVESIRVYHGAELPVQYGLNQCGGVLIETRSGPDPEDADAQRGSGLFRRLMLVGMIVFGVLMAM